MIFCYCTQDKQILKLSGCVNFECIKRGLTRYLKIKKLLNKEIIEKIILDYNELDCLDPLVFDFINLKDLSAKNNKIEKIPKEIENAVNLETLELQSNRISEIAEEIGKLSKLKFLDLERNKLKKLPCGIGNLVNLEVVHFGYNELCDIPEEM
jgi:leucine-rich repeat protein SHOC2